MIFELRNYLDTL